MTRHPRFILFLASFLMLYFELVVIRWVPGHVRVLAYFTNFVLIACFFGMGLGMILSKNPRDFGRWAPVGLLVLVALTILFKVVWVAVQGVGVLIFTQYDGGGGPVIALFPLLVVFYLAVAAAFVPFGQLIGRSFGSEAPLWDYSVNLVGSMAGIVVFFFYSWLSLPAWAWFLLGLPLLALLAPPQLSSRAVALVAAAAIVAVVAYVDHGTIWSPYQKVDVTPFGIARDTGALMPYMRSPADVDYLPPEIGFCVRVNDDFYQLPVNLSDDNVKRYPALRAMKTQYELPYKLKPNAERVLIVGGGTGNDAAAALRWGAKHIDVVDIDPEIVALGRQRHPEQPYSDPRVHIHIDDARHFFHHAEPGYDVIVFALLDSHRLLSTLSSLRLDSYVFTVESFQEARRLLKPAGIQVTAFAAGEAWMKPRFYEMLRQAYGKEPILANEHNVATSAGLVFLSSPSGRVPDFAPKSRPVDTDAVLAVDDWPFIYMRGRFIPAEYLLALALVIAVSLVVLRRATGQRGWPDAHFFCLGAAFLLLETKNVTTVALVFGSTWYVNSVVFFSVLVMALLANLVAGWAPGIRAGWAYAGLFAALALNALLPLQNFAGESMPVRLIVVGGVTALPLFFSGIVFAHSFQRAADPAQALGANVLGGVFGGVLEYLSMMMGLRFLFLPIAAFYALSLVALRRPAEQPEPAAPALAEMKA